MEKNRILMDDMWSMIAKYLNGEATDSEKSVVENWIEASDQNKEEFNQCRELLDKTDVFFLSKHFNADKAYETVSRKATSINSQEDKRRSIVYPAFLKYAAAALILFTVGIASIYIIPGNRNKEMLVLVTKAQEQKTITLPDGTNITLNGNTRFVYPEEFTANSRNVEIEGEAFFDVAPDPAKPFVISAGDAQIRVLGTSFNVLAYPESETVEVVVETGMVQVVGSSGDTGISNEVLLEPGEKATVIKKIKSVQKQVNDDLNYNSWKTGNFNFDKSSLQYVIETLEKSFQIEIEIADPEIETLKYSAQFEDKSVDFILDVIRLTFNLELKTEGNAYYLSKRKN